MKKVTLILFLGMFVGGAAYAQEERVVLKKVSESEVPAEVVEAIKKDFPQSVVDQIKILPADGIDGWKVTDVQNTMSPNDEMSYYAIDFYGDGVSGEVLYDEDGNMIVYKKVITNEALPPSIRNHIGTTYSGWAFIKDKEVIKKTPNSATDVYTVVIKKGKEKKILHYDSAGNPLD
ncbi:PepSY-like domain-containing protein [Echinicola strongylocentroti]|nr:PepSY-like domain-containing protein [Echinicola strongylocentroti]